MTSFAHSRRRLRVTGTVQGVGFRPHVHNLAVGLGLSGMVGNDGVGVFIEVEGPTTVLDRFGRLLVDRSPPLAVIDVVTTVDITPQDAAARDPKFIIVPSSAADGGHTAGAPPDTATCAACRAEMADPANRRFRHPFITCTDCGPRFTIIERLPYDRPATTMSRFPLCPACDAEYRDPSDRRFHAQPVSCHDCGPTLSLVAPDVATTGTDQVIAATQRLLRDGAIVAVKGIGGYHLACRADQESVVAKLRTRKQRPAKPFALIVRDLATARRLAEVTAAEAAVLASPEAPIVLLRRRPRADFASAVAPGNPLVGIMLASNPLHHLLLAQVPSSSEQTAAGDVTPLDVLVMTSGNLSDEPLCIDGDEALERLSDVADAFLAHDRPIAVPCDDSVVRVLTDGVSMIRRSRGYVPTPIRLPRHGRPALSLGAELKATVALSDGVQAWLSPHLGDMGSLSTLRTFERTIRRTETMHHIEPAVLACDAHPDHTAHRWALRNAGTRPVLTVQHHHAHIAAVMAEHGVDRPVIGLAFDGTGYGPDGTIWGGEILRVTYDGFERLAHLSPTPLPGGDSAIRHPRRMALSHLWSAGLWDPDTDVITDLPSVLATSEQERRVLAVQLRRHVNVVDTTSMGRLFDAVASILGICHDITFEAQAAIQLEIVAQTHADAGGLPALLDLPVTVVAAHPAVMDCTRLLRDLVAHLRTTSPVRTATTAHGQGEQIAAAALGFHHAVADACTTIARAERRETGIDIVALSGGVFANALLTRLVTERLELADFTVIRHRRVPPNDGGIALGQVAVAVAPPHDDERTRVSDS